VYANSNLQNLTYTTEISGKKAKKIIFEKVLSNNINRIFLYKKQFEKRDIQVQTGRLYHLKIFGNQPGWGGPTPGGEKIGAGNQFPKIRWKR
jgi:hypothetical protein